MSNLETFRLRLEQLRDQGVDIDVNRITEEVMNPPMEEIKDLSEEEKKEQAFALTIRKTIELINDFKEHYRPKGRTLKIIVRIEKENSADAYGEQFVYDDDISIINMIEIGTKGKYEKAIEEV